MTFIPKGTGLKFDSLDEDCARNYHAFRPVYRGGPQEVSCLCGEFKAVVNGTTLQEPGAEGLLFSELEEE